MRKSFNKSISKSASSDFLSKTRKIMSFRTIMKPRNETIADNRYEIISLKRQSVNLEKSTVNKNQNNGNGIIQKSKSNKLQLKQYVKNMGSNQMQNKHEKQIVKSKVYVDQDDKLSKKSSRSCLSKHISKQFSNLEQKSQLTIEELIKKIQLIIQENLTKISLKKGCVGLSNWIQQLQKIKMTDKQYSDFCELIVKLRNKYDENNKNQQNNDDYNKKIQIFQKLIASQNFYHQLIRNQYFNWKSQKFNTSSYGKFNKANATLSSSMYRQTKQIRKQLFKYQNVRIPKQPVTKYLSINSTAFKKPNKQSYPKKIIKKNEYQTNRQPLLMSTYSTQFLNYGIIPTYNFKKDDIRLNQTDSIASKHSCYQLEYKDKFGLSKRMQFRDLDCMKNKFKNTDISFMNSSKKSYHMIVEDKQNKKYNISIDSSQINLKDKSQDKAYYNKLNTVNHYKTQHNRQYKPVKYNIVDEKDSILKSQMKNKKMQSLKNAFKALAICR